jgi:hypothetical protein
VRRLWSKATAEERQKLVEPLIDLVLVDMDAKVISEVRPAPAVAALLPPTAA